MEKVDWKVEGMTCSNCALTINKYLQKEGLQDVAVNPISGSVRFTKNDAIEITRLKKGIDSLGYHVIDGEKKEYVKEPFLSNNKKRFLFTLPFTLVLMLHMLHKWLPLHWLMNPWIQLSICLPVFITGMWFFGRSAVKSLQNGMPNMNVLIALGAAPPSEANQPFFVEISTSPALVNRNPKVMGLGMPSRSSYHVTASPV